MKKLLVSSIGFAFSILAVSADSLDNVVRLFETGNYEAAKDTLEMMRTSTPNDMQTNLWYGIVTYALGDEHSAQESLKKASEAGSLDAYQLLTHISLRNFQIEEAKKNISQWRAALKKANKPVPSELTEYEDNLQLINSQLSRVEDIPVIARYDVKRSIFDKELKKAQAKDANKGTHFIAGKIPFFINNTLTEMYWTEPDSNKINRLYMAGVLDDGTLDTPVELTQYIGDGDIRNPYLLDDGETLYFAASHRKDGLGGYDIYLTRRNDDGGFLEPSNIGMPYNSPGDDLLFVIDESNNIGWWVTDRLTSPDSVSVLVFVPNKSRINIDADTENVTARAKVTDLAATYKPGFDLAAAKNRIPKPGKEQEKKPQSPLFSLSLGDGRVVSGMEDFKSRDAAKAMSDVLRTRKTLEDTMERLAVMRRAYADGDKSLAGDIRALETEVEKQQTEVKNQTNRVIKLELSAR